MRATDLSGETPSDINMIYVFCLFNCVLTIILINEYDDDTSFKSTFSALQFLR